MITRGVFEALEPGDDQDINQHEHRGKCQSEIPEDFIGDMPFPIPFHRQAVGIRGLLRRVGFEAVSFRQLHRPDLLIHVQDRIHGAFLAAGNIGSDIDDRHQVFMIDVPLAHGFFPACPVLRAEPAFRKPKQREVCSALRCWNGRQAEAAAEAEHLPLRATGAAALPAIR